MDELAAPERTPAESPLFARAVLDALPQQLCVLDGRGTIVAVNHAWRRFAEENGGDPARVSEGANYLTASDSSDGRSACDGIRAVLDGRSATYYADYPCHSPTRERWFAVRVSRFAGNPARAVVTHTDITERKRAEERLMLAAAVFAAVSQAIAVTGPDNRIVSVNPAFTEVLGYREDDVAGQSLWFLATDRHDETFFEQALVALQDGGAWEGEIWARQRGGALVPLWLTVDTVYDNRGAVSRRVAVFADISARKVAEERVYRLAHFDALTGLPNRVLLHDRLQQALHQAQRHRRRAAVLFLDLDGFKEVNDRHGHEAGDALLKEVASRLNASVRREDTVARLGGDEFVVLLPVVNGAEGAARAAEKVLAALQLPFRIRGAPADVGASIGIALYPDHAEDGSTLLKHADAAMYRAKAAGRGRWVLFERTFLTADASRPAPPGGG
ncbi:MAG: diguanylate cyclase domain-containing protein [Pseudomonadota bacterium]